MNGETFKQAIKEDGRFKKDIASLLGIDRQRLNDYEKIAVVPDEIIEKAKKIGIKFPENVATKTGQFTAKEALEMADRMADKVREDYRDSIENYKGRIEDLTEHISMLTGLLKKHKILT